MRVKLRKGDATEGTSCRRSKKRKKRDFQKSQKNLGEGGVWREVSEPGVG